MNPQPPLSHMTSLEVLFSMRELLNKPERWTKGCMARAEDGRQVRLTHVHARQFSLEGAMYRVQYITKARILPAHELLKGLIHPRKVVPLASYNDAAQLTHQSLLNLLDLAITKLGGTPPMRETEE